MTTKFKNITAIKQANIDAGQFWFSPNTLKFFNCIVYPTVYYGRYFVTSEQNDLDPELPEPREYSVRYANSDGTIATVKTGMKSRANVATVVDQSFTELTKNGAALPDTYPE